MSLRARFALPSPGYHIPVLAACLALIVGCSGHSSSPTAPRESEVPSLSAPPIQIRSDAGDYGRVDPIEVLSAELASGRILKLRVAYGGGCKTHTIDAIGAANFFASYPAQLALFVRHDGSDDRCEAYIMQDLEFDIAPALRLYRDEFGKLEPFYLRILTPDTSKSILLLVK